MADVKISQLPEVPSVNTGDVMPVVASGVTSKIQVQNFGLSITSSYALSASYATTASYVINLGGTFPYTGSAIISGALSVTGSISTTAGITSSLFGTASWAENVVSASYAQTASSADQFFVRGNLTGSNALFTGTITAQTLVVQTVSSSVVYSSGSNTFGNKLTDVQQFTGSVRITGSLTVAGRATIPNLTASLFGTASYATNAGTASFVTASNVWGPFGSNSVVTASYAVSTSFAETASYVKNAQSASYVLNAISSSFASTASFVRLAQSASYAITASYALNAGGSGQGFPFTGSAIISGSLIVTGSISTDRDTNIGSTNLSTQVNSDVDTGAEVVASVSTGSYSSAFFDYFVQDGTNYRAGTVLSVWNSSGVIRYTDTSTTDIGDTSPITFDVIITDSTASLQATATTNNWNVKTFVRAF